MGIAERKDRQKAEREIRITTAARRIAEAEGWNAVTIRRLSEEIEYSQPVLYAHFENRDAIVAAVTLDGFRDLTSALRAAAQTSANPAGAMQDVATAYLDFARNHPALYEAMFTLPSALRFGHADTRPELRQAFDALAAVFPPSGRDVELATETLWAALHGLADLERSGRIRQSARAGRVALVVGLLL